MTIGNVAYTGKLLLGTSFEEGWLVANEGVIESVSRGIPNPDELPDIVVDAPFITPGLIDLQVNGATGVQVDTVSAHIDQISAWSLQSGVTAWLPTVVTANAEHYDGVFDAWAGIDPKAGAVPLGYHIEGPFLSPARKGAHQLRYIEAASDELFERWLGESSIRLVTLAPEREGGHQRIRKLVERGVVVSLGHTDATFEELAAGADAGATMATHLFNAMSPIHHRNPGAMVGTLLDPRLVTGIIPDAIHSHPAMVRLAIAAKGLDGIAVVSDMMSACGLGDGTFELGGQTVSVSGGRVTLPDGTLAGSMLTMDQAVRNLVDWGGLTFAEAVTVCSRVPADVLSDRVRGRLVVGARADITLWDDHHTVIGTHVAGVARWTA